MQSTKRRTRFGIVAIGALVGSMLSVGVATSDVSAKSIESDQQVIVVEVDEQPEFVKIKRPIYSSLQSGIRW